MKIIKKRGRPRKLIVIGATYGAFTVLSHHADEMFAAICEAGHEQIRSEKDLRRQQHGCAICAKDRRKTIVVGSVVGYPIGQFTVVSLTGRLDKRGKSIVVIECSNCQGRQDIGIDKLNQSRKRSQKIKCPGCVEKQFRTAVQSPLILTERQCTKALDSAKKGVFASGLPAKLAAEIADDVISEVMCTLFAKGSTGVIVTEEGVGALAYRLAQMYALRVTHRDPLGRRLEPVETEDGDESDIFDRLNTDKPETVDDSELEQTAVDSSLSPEDKQWALDHLSQKGSTSKASKKRFAALIDSVRTSYIEMLSAIEGGVDA